MERRGEEVVESGPPGRFTMSTRSCVGLASRLKVAEEAQELSLSPPSLSVFDLSAGIIPGPV